MALSEGAIHAPVCHPRPFYAAVSMTFAQSVEAGVPRRQPGDAVQRRGQGRRPDLRLRHARQRRRRQGADQAGARQHQRHAEDRRLEPRERRERHRLPRNQSDFAGDERGLPRLLDQGSAGAHDRDGAAAQRRAGRDRGGRGARRRRARRRQPERVDRRRRTRTATASRPATRCSCPG